jgi:hypothetical protein
MDPHRVLLLRRRPYAWMAAIVILLAAAARAQETRGTILGTVRDSSGGALPGITVLITNEETSASNEVVTNERGAFEIPYLLPGRYQIVAQAQGFKKFTQNGLVLTVNSRLELPVTLEVGVITDEVTVTAEAPLLETTSSASATLTNRQVNVLPIFGNSALLLARAPCPGCSGPGSRTTSACIRTSERRR